MKVNNEGPFRVLLKDLNHCSAVAEANRSKCACSGQSKMFLSEAAGAAVTKWECHNVPATERFELEKSFQLSDSTSSTEREKDQNTHLGIKEFSERLASANPGWFGAWNWGGGWNTFKQTSRLARRVNMPSSPPRARLSLQLLLMLLLWLFLSPLYYVSYIGFLFFLLSWNLDGLEL